MKKLFIAAVACVLVTTSCNQVAGWFGSAEDSVNVNTTGSEWVIDESINESNAYSDLFLDSAAIESFIRKENISDSAAGHIRNFYKVRNFQYAWFTTSGLTEQGKGFWHLQMQDSAKTEGDALQTRMDSLMMNDSMQVQRGDSAYVQTELALTKEFIAYASQHEGLDAARIYHMVPAKRMDPVQLADRLLNKHADSAMFAGNEALAKMKEHLRYYHDAVKNGGWQPIQGAANLRQGSSSPTVSAIKRRLAMTNDYQGGDTSAVYSDSLATAIKAYQQRNGLQPTGQINDSLIQSLNVPAQERLEQILVNMNRMMWMENGKDSNRIVVNIPSYMLYAYEGSNKALEMPVIVGKEGTNTIMFTGEINQVVFNPAWNIPQSIVERDIMPKMKNDKNYLQKNNMEIVNQNDSIPQIRQKPGPNNAMGSVKFLFPNSYDIYLHDTPDKSLFAKKDRALSNGCIRVQDPQALAAYILKDQSEWDTQKISNAMKGNNEQTVRVNNKKPVYITYYTAWVDESGQLQFRNDVYGHDQGTRSRMFTRS